MHGRKVESSECLGVACPRRVVVVRLVRFSSSLDPDCTGILCR
jgi:hypothetical protein